MSQVRKGRKPDLRQSDGFIHFIRNHNRTWWFIKKLCKLWSCYVHFLFLLNFIWFFASWHFKNDGNLKRLTLSWQETDLQAANHDKQQLQGNKIDQRENQTSSESLNEQQTANSITSQNMTPTKILICYCQPRTDIHAENWNPINSTFR